MARARVLVVEDDPSYQELYETLLGRLHRDEFIGLLAKTAKVAREQLRRHPSPPIDAVVLDWQLPDGDGLSLLREIRANPATKDLIVFMVTGNAQEKEAAAALQAMADDYINKPFREEELCLRLRNHLERWRTAQEERGVFALDGLRVGIKDKAVTLNGNQVSLRPKEFDLLLLLLERPDVLHSQGYLADALSMSSEAISHDALRQHICHLKKALGAWGDHIEARYGQGYVLHSQPPISRS